MAEFKLGRIRFVWKNEWAGSTVYYKDDVVTYEGQVYICVLGHTSTNNFLTDFDIVPAKWNIMSKGQVWKGEWTRSTDYALNNIVKFGPNLYICVDVHTSTADTALVLTDENQYWELYAAGLQWKSNWATNTLFRTNDIVKYGGINYICTTSHTSALTEVLGLEDDFDKWQEFSTSLDYKSEWQADYRYKKNDVVKFGAGLYIAKTHHVSAISFGIDNLKWDVFVEGLTFENVWTSTGFYQQGDIVTYGGYQYIANRVNQNSVPSQNPTNWTIFSKGFDFVGEWGEDSSSQEYKPGEVVTVGGFTYVSKVVSINKEPGEASDWADYWDRLSTGIRWRNNWIDDAYYVEGDVVRYNNTTFICIESHVSEGNDFSTETRIPPGGGAENSRPDLDTAGRYWNVFTIGAETDPMQEKGDMVYFSGVGPTRLPIGKEGQVLRVNTQDEPEWTFFGQNPDVYYVSTTGIDGPTPSRGTTQESPFKSIRFACQTIINGAKNPNAKQLLELNKLFIMRETVEWTEYQISSGTAPFVPTFTYEAWICQRDIGFIIDAIIYDISHGGNVKSREAALSYVNEPGRFYILGQADETAASINYALSLVEKILTQTAPDTNYQVFNGDNSTAIVPQYTNPNIVAEPVLAEITSLMKIITDAIYAGNDELIPTRYEKNTLIRVATGVYFEVLPIMVPAFCCVMGDELRSVTVQPRKNLDQLTPLEDLRYTYTALDHLTEIVDDVVTGVVVSPSVGNNEAQDYGFPVGKTREGANALTLARINKRLVDFGTGKKLEIEWPKPYNMTRPADGYGRQNLLLNKDFLKNEIEAWITANYPDLLYSRTKCKQDVGYIVDAICYDITYGGNYQTLQAAFAYYDGASGNLQIDSTEKTATLLAYDYLRELMQQVARNQTINNPYVSESVDSQTRTGDSADATTANRIFSLMTDFSTLLNDVNAAPTWVYPDITGATAALQTDKTNLSAAYTSIQEQTIDFIVSNFGDFTYRGEYCRRDSQYILTGQVLDAQLGSTFWGTYTGYSYNRAQASKVKTDQAVQELAAIDYIGARVVEILDAQGTTGGDTASARVANYTNEIKNIFNNGDASASAIVYTEPTGTLVPNRTNARIQIIANKAYIAQFTAQGNTYYQNLSSELQAKCRSDLERALETWAYDIQYDQTPSATGCNIATVNFIRSLYNRITGESVYGTAAERSASIQLYNTLANNVKDAIVNNLFGQDPGVTVTASQAEQDKVDVLRDIITDSITANDLSTAPTEIAPETDWATPEIRNAIQQVNLAYTDIVNGTLQYITTIYSGFDFDHAKCSRDLGIIMDSASYDWCLDSNFASMVAAYSYLRRPSAKVTGYQKEATLAANEYARQLAVAELTDPLAIAKLNYTFTFVNDMIFGGSNEAANKQIDNVDVNAAIRTLQLNTEFIVEELTNYVDNYYQTNATAFGANNQITVDTTDWMEVGIGIKFVGGTGIIIDTNIIYNTEYFVRSIIDSATITISTEFGGDEFVFTLGDVTQTVSVEKSYVYNNELCKRDIREIVAAMQWDLYYPAEYVRSWSTSSLLRTYNFEITYPANYKTKYCARWYNNSVLGSKEEDMYYLRNNTGLRLQTVDGLDGDLTPVNEYGTSRVTAGAYASLDPGWGPDDESVWILTRSPYVQNLTTFGHAAIGQKIDGALHNGGNDSIVSNDFTQVISDGIGAWITNNGRAELVSVFTYYSHIGYLAEAGGRIRATNGNNSYGTFGSVAEGVDTTEIPITGVVDNKLQFNAVIAAVNVDGDEIINVEYSHAGNDYTEALISIFGNGINASTYADEFRDNAVNRITILDPNDSSNVQGGSGYLIATNTAQTGTLTSITLAATDGENDTAYPGMRIFITGGTAVGQYATVATYSSGTKLATVEKNDGTPGWEQLNPGVPIVAPNASSVYLIEPKITFTAPPYSTTRHTQAVTENTTDITYAEFSAVFSNMEASSTTSLSGFGAQFRITRVTSKYYVEITGAGTGYERNDTITITGDLLGGVAETNDLTITVTSISETGQITVVDSSGLGRSGMFVSVGNGSQVIQKSFDGESWTSQNIGGNITGPTKIANGKLGDASSLDVDYSTVIVGQSQNTNQIFYSFNLIDWAAANLPQAYDSEPFIAYGDNQFFIIFEGSRDVFSSTDGGITWTQNVAALPSTGFRGLTYGAERLVAVKFESNEAVYANIINLSAWTSTVLPSASDWKEATFGNNRFIAISTDDNVVAYSLDRGETWSETTIPADGSTTSNTKQIKYGQGLFVIVDDTQGETIYTSQYGVEWELKTVQGDPDLANNTGFQALAFGNPQQIGCWILKGLGSETYVEKAKIGVTAFARPGIANQQIYEIRILEPGCGYINPPTMTVTDPNNIFDVVFDVQLGKGCLANPTFINRGVGYEDASGEVVADASNGYAEFTQTGNFIAVRRLSEIPIAGSNVVFDHKPNVVFKLVNTVSFVGLVDGSYTAFLNLSPSVEPLDAPPEATPFNMRIKYSQVRLTGHDFLDIGTGGFTKTNYPNLPLQAPNQLNETVENNGGRVFFTATDQDGNFRVGGLFNVEQSTGIATLNADAFNLAGLQELSLGEVTLGGNSASINEFSTDPFMTANSNSVVPTQRAIKSYIEAQIGGGGASLNVNTITAGDIFIGTNEITTVTGNSIRINATVEFRGGVAGYPLASALFMR